MIYMINILFYVHPLLNINLNTCVLNPILIIPLPPLSSMFHQIIILTPHPSSLIPPISLSLYSLVIPSIPPLPLLLLIIYLLIIYIYYLYLISPSFHISSPILPPPKMIFPVILLLLNTSLYLLRLVSFVGEALD